MRPKRCATGRKSALVRIVPLSRRRSSTSRNLGSVRPVMSTMA
jgi:hypothetical protein